MDRIQTPAALVVTPATSASADFGTVSVGSMQDEIFTVRNTGEQTSGPVTVALPTGAFAVLPPGAGECSSGATLLGGGTSCNVRVRFVPARPGRYTATLTASAASGGTSSLPLLGLTTGVWAVAAGASSYHTCALVSPGTVSCWGINDSGQLGTATPGPGFAMSSIPLRVTGLENVVAVAVGANHSCAVLVDGTMRCWGDNSYGKLGSTTAGTASVTPVAVGGLSTVVSAVAGTDFTCALLQEGTLRCWGRNDSGQLGAVTPDTKSTTPVAVGILSAVTTMAAGAAHVCAVAGAGVVNCWGSGTFGKLGNAMTTDSTTPVMVGLSSLVTSVATGNTQTCALRANRTIDCWGKNDNGQLGDPSAGAMSSSPVSVVVPEVDFIAIGGGAFHTCAIHASGIPSCWGLNSNGQLGPAAASPSSAMPAVVPDAADSVAVTGGEYHTCALSRTGTVSCWGDNSTGQLGRDISLPQSSLPLPITF